jgi:hypothetical protein
VDRKLVPNEVNVHDPGSVDFSPEREDEGPYIRQIRRQMLAIGAYVFGNRVAGSGLDRAYQGKRELDHRTSE